MAAKDLSLLYQSSFVRDDIQAGGTPSRPQVLSNLYDACVQNAYILR